MEIQITVKKDGDSYCATFSDFKNLQESPAAFGETLIEAISNLLKQNSK